MDRPALRAREHARALKPSRRATRGDYRTNTAYDEDLADRICELAGLEPDLSEQQMFGGLAFLIGGHMAVAASGRGSPVVRVDPARSVPLMAFSVAEPMAMAGREMAGWLRIAPAGVSTKRRLPKWVDPGVAFARSPPPKTGNPPRKRRRPSAEA